MNYLRAMPDDTNPLASLDQSSVNALAIQYLATKARAAERSKKHRERKREAGLVPVTTDVQAERAGYVRQNVKAIVALSGEEFDQLEARRKEGFVPIFGYVPANRANYIRNAIETLVELSDDEFAQREAWQKSKEPQKQRHDEQ